MDVLSEILRAVKLEGALFFNAEFSAPWCLSSPCSSAIAPYLTPTTGRVILYHYLTEGRAYVRLADGRREELRAGDILVLPHGDAHFLGNGSPERPVDSLKTFGRMLTEKLDLVRFGGGGEVTKFVCGFMVCEPRLSDVFLGGLPPMVRVQVANESSGQWLEQSIRFSVGEVNGAHAGSGLVLAKLSELLFVETLRRYISSLPADQVGWLAGARDALVGKVLALMHKEPAHPWTVPLLAKKVGTSRTRLAERFRHFIGESPMAYLAQWRLKLGAELLQSSDASVGEIAIAVGYGSEAAFNRAFKREFESPPARFRKRNTATGAENPVP